MLSTSIESQTHVWVQPTRRVDNNTLLIGEKGDRTRAADKKPKEIEENAISQLFLEQINNHALKRKQLKDVQKGADANKKHRVDEVVVSLGKGVSEISHMLDITSMLKSKKFMNLHTCTRANGLQSKGFGFPPPLMIKLKQDDVGEAFDILSRGLVDSRKVVKVRAKFNEQLLGLKQTQNWRIINHTELLSEKQAMAAPSSSGSGTATARQRAVPFNMDRIGIDLSFSSCGDVRARDVDKSFVPLIIHDVPGETGGSADAFSSVGVNAPLYPLLNAPVMTMRCSIVSMDGASVGTVSLWEALQCYYAAQLSGGTNTDAETEDNIHNICIKRQHNLLSQRLFMLLRSDCLNSGPAHQAGAPLPLVDLCTGASRLSATTREPAIGAVGAGSAESAPKDFSLEDVVADIGTRPPTRLVVQHISLTKIILQLSFRFSLQVELVPVTQEELLVGPCGGSEGGKVQTALTKTLLSLLYKLLTSWEHQSKHDSAAAGVVVGGAAGSSSDVEVEQREYCSTQKSKHIGKPGASASGQGRAASAASLSSAGSATNGTRSVRFVFELFQCVISELHAKDKV
jgi:hypothetical protein